jgi:hypothetical protein
MVELTCERMAGRALYDQLGGGFARYCLDAEWTEPHYEKMLSDNALLLGGYAHLARRTGSAPARRVAEETAAFLLADLRTADGGFAAALDADTDGVEGLTYLWTPEQLRMALGDDDGRWAAELLSVDTLAPPRLRQPTDDIDRWARVRGVLSAARGRRPQPARDDKVVTAWNGLAIGALAEAGAAWDRRDWLDAAVDAATLVLDVHVVDGRLRRSSRDGVVGAAAGVLEDHGCLAAGLLALHQATGQARWLAAALELLDVALAHFAGFYDTADDAETLLHRPRDLTDGAGPSGSAAIAGALLTASVLAEPSAAARYGEAAAAAMASAGTVVERQPRFAGHWLSVAEAAAHGPLQVALVGPDDDPHRSALAIAARRAAPGGTVVVAGPPDAPGVPLLADRPLIDGGAAAYVCRGFACDRPVTTEQDVTAALGGTGSVRRLFA